VTSTGSTEEPEKPGTDDHPQTAGYRRKIRITHAVVALLTTAGGAVMGFIVTLAIVVAKARYGHYIFALEDLAEFRWELLPIPLGAAAGFRLAYKRPHAVAWATVAGFGAMVVGIVAGALLGPLLWGDGAGHWAGGVILGAIGLVGGAVGSLRIRHVPRNHLVAGGASTIVFLGLISFAIFGATNLLDIDPLDFPKSFGVPVPDAAKVDAVVFLVGDAGAALTGRFPLLSALRTDVERWSSALHRDSAVSVAFLGDNVYPVGIRPRKDPGFPADSMRLWSQFDLVSDTAARRFKTLGLFVTGNHDWANSASDIGFDRVISLSDQMRAARADGRYVALLPAAGDPGPVYRDLRRNVRIAFFDTHWFLRERHPAQRAAFFSRLRKTLDGARDREVILIAHHPYRSSGPHGAIVPGYHTLGIAYVMKKAGALIQDLNSPPYDDLRAGLRATFDGSRKPPLIYAGGHDHSLQVLSGEEEFDPRFVLVSGAGSKSSSVDMGPGLAWASDQPGYMMLVFRKDDGVDLFVVGGDKGHVECAGSAEEIALCMTDGVNAFTIVYSASLLGPSKAPPGLTAPIPDTLAQGTPWWTDEAKAPPVAAVSAPGPAPRPAPVAVPTRVLLQGVDSVTTTTGRTYPAGRIRRMLAGHLNRHLWRIPIRLPVLDLAAEGGGLHPVRITGGRQTVGLRLIGRDGVEYDFRPVIKNPAAVLPTWLREGFLRDALDDQMAAQFPMGATLVAALQEDVGILAPRPVTVVMPNDARLGQYRSMFAGRVGLFSVNPNERLGNRPGFGGYSEIEGSDSMYAKTRADPESTFDDRQFLKIRLIDALVGDWDRHSGQWRWGVERTGSRALWRAIPEDRDWAFAATDGPVTWVARWLLPSYVGFGPNLPSPRRLAVSGQRVDHRVLNRLGEEDFAEVARDIRTALTDSVIESALGALQPEYAALTRGYLVKSLESRRDQLLDYAVRYYRYLARTVHVYGFDASTDVVEFERISEKRARVRVRAGGPDGPVRFERLIDARETGEVKLFIDEGVDRIVGGDDLPFKVTIAKDSPDSGESRRP
jgi:hypothetical protein